MELNGKNDDKRDDFWDIDKLIPKKKTTKKPFMSTDPVRTIDIPAQAGADSDEENENGRLSLESMRGFASVNEETYEPEYKSLIKEVKIKRSIDKYDFYDGFRKAALIYFGYRTEKCDFVKFYSYMPQYSQLSTEQKNYYFYWRDMMYRGKFLKTDYSYVYLYVYEVLNLPDKIPPIEGIERLCTLWKNYRHDLPRLDLYFSEWVMDYCLVHRLPCPYEYISDFIFDIVAVADFKEFYLSAPDGEEKNSISALLAYVSDCDWRSGRYSSGVSSAEGASAFSAEEYKCHMEDAMSLLLSRFKADIFGECERSPLSSFSRQAFRNSLCTHAVKCNLAVSYRSLKNADALRRALTAAVRYTENKLRFIMGVKSRIAVRDLPEDYKAVIDRYFESLANARAKMAEKHSAPEYERLYDAPSAALSFDGAEEIEKSSWQTTKRLVNETDFDAQEQFYSITLAPGQAKETTKQDAPASAQPTKGEDGLGEDDKSILSSLLKGEACMRTDMDFVGAVARINEFFVDHIGDIVLEERGGGYFVIEDYCEEIEIWLK